MAQSPEIIKSLQGEKIYLQESFIEKVSPSKFGGMIHINAETKVYLPLLFSDDKGYWTSVMTEFWNKIFHQICNVCHYEWEAKWYEFECPNCGSTDFSNISI